MIKQSQTLTMETNLQQHNHELIVRIFWYLISFVSIFIISYFHQTELSCLWVAGLEDSIWELEHKLPKMQYLTITEGFQTWVEMHFYWSLLWSFPILLYQMTQFLKPGLHKNEWQNLIVFGLKGTCIILAIAAVLFTQYLWPHILEVLFRFGIQQADFVPNMQALLSFYKKTVVAFAIASVFPWFSVLLVNWNLLSYKQTVAFRRWWILLIFLIATIMSPPDVLSQLMIALPLWLFLEVSWLLLAFMEAKKLHKKE